MAKKSKKPADPVLPDLTIPVAYGDVSIGEETCRIGVSIARQHLELSVADTQICGKRLIGCITCRPGNSNPDQPTMAGMEEAEAEIPGAFDVKRISFNNKFINFGLTFSIESIDIAGLAHFAKRSGNLVVTEITAIPDDKATGNGGDEGDDE
jgi:hypothetical protein